MPKSSLIKFQCCLLLSVLIVKRREKFLNRYKQFEIDHNCFIFCFIDVVIRTNYVNYVLSYISHFLLYLYFVSFVSTIRCE